MNFPFETNGKLMILGVPILKHFRVYVVIRCSGGCGGPCQDNYENLDPSYKMNLDFRNCFGKETSMFSLSKQSQKSRFIL